MRLRLVAIALGCSLITLTLSLGSGAIGLLWPEDGFEKECKFAHHALCLILAHREIRAGAAPAAPL